MTVTEALEKSGYHPSRIKNIESVLLEPEFWQSLGKTLVWDGQLWCGRQGCGNDGEHFHTSSKENWLPKWHALIDHLASGNDIESYFKTL